VGVCVGIRRSGGRCTVSVEPGQTYCHHHDPARADERRRAASRAGKSKPSQEIKDIKRQLEDLAADVLAGNVERGDAVVVNQILNTRARLIELERKVKETDELEARLEALEQVQEQRGGSKWRGA
jgi:hypothetical protein